MDCNVLYSTVLHCTILQYTSLHCTVQFSTALYYSLLHCTVLYCNGPDSTVLYLDAGLHVSLSELPAVSRLHTHSAVEGALDTRHTQAGQVRTGEASEEEALKEPSEKYCVTVLLEHESYTFASSTVMP